MAPSRERLIPGFVAPEPAGEALCCGFQQDRLWVVTGGGEARLPGTTELGLGDGDRGLYLGCFRDRHVFARELDAVEPSGVAEAIPLRRTAGLLDDASFWLAATAIQLLRWDRDHRFCGRCGGHTRRSDRERARLCPRCELAHYPRVSPAVIVLVRRGDELLLARSPHFAPGVFSTLAGFVDSGESLEDAVHREVAEEVGLEVTNLRYFGSQPWPFPHSLMVGYLADWASGALSIDGEEIEAADWFPWWSLPAVPAPVSIARALIDHAVESARRGG